MVQLQNDLSEFVGLLISFKVEFLVVGGYAVAFHGHPRLTGDVDFFIRATPENAERIVQVLEDFGFGSLAIGAADFTTPDRILQLGRPPNRIDILTSISGVGFDECWADRVPGELGGHTVNYLGWDALIKNKIASGRDKDQMDVKTLKRIAAQKKG